ncbi:MAG: hypothetical protein K6D98_05645 [Clostridiales bacterium]|nr:hypothetical protein [Clostridiales bacterium]
MIKKIMFAAAALIILVISVSASPIVESVESSREHYIEPTASEPEVLELSASFDGSGTPDDPYLISSTEDMNKLANLVNNGNMLYSGKSYKLTTDLDFSDTNMIPIGNSEDTPFMGDFDGDGYAVKNVTITASGSNATQALCVGLFPYCVNATIKNLFVINLDITAQSDYTVYAGGICAYFNTDSNEKDYYIENCSVNAKMNISSKLRSIVGGIVGNIDNKTTNEIKVSVLNNTADVDIFSSARSNQYVGGIIGLVDQKKLTYPVQNCFTQGSIELDLLCEFCAGGIVGGIIGTDSGVTESETRFDFDNCFTLCDIFYTGTPKSKRYYISALVGRSSSEGTTGNLYYADDITLSPSSAVSVQAVSGTPVERSTLLSREFLENNMNFDFDNTWTIKNGMPTLKIRKPMVMSAYVSGEQIILNISNPSPSYLFAAGYADDGRMINCIRSFATGATSTFPLSAFDGASTIKIMAFDTLYNIHPACEAAVTGI